MSEGKNTVKVNSKQYEQLKLLNVYLYNIGIYKLASTVMTPTEGYTCIDTLTFHIDL